MVRCQQPACPAQRDIGVGADPKMMLGILASGVMLAGALGALIWLWPAPEGKSAGLGNRGADWKLALARGDAPASGTGSSGKAPSWLDTLLGRKSAPVVTAPSSGLDLAPAARVGSFSCSGARGGARALVCSDWTLATADYNLSLVYRTAIEHSHRRAAIARAQDAWLAQLDRLGNDSAAITAHYEKRLAELTAVTQGS